MKQIEATYRIVTPMFLGGADTNELADAIRPPSVKGALRFWWRARFWAAHRAKASEDETVLREMHRQEAALFGSAAGEHGGGQSAFVLRTELEKPIRSVNDWPEKNTGSGYLGLGLFESGSTADDNYQPQRPALFEGGKFNVIIRFRPNSSDEEVESLTNALRMFGLLGGLGGRGQRRGFGSVAIVSLNGENTELENAETYIAELRTLISKADVQQKLPPYTALGEHTRVELIAEAANARAAHNRMGEVYREYRRYNPAVKSALRGAQKLPFGLPLSGANERSRRSSPLLFHVHRTKREKFQFQGVAAFIPARFHYRGRYESVSYGIVEDFLEWSRLAVLFGFSNHQAAAR